MSNFVFLKAGWPDLHDAASKAESSVYPDARSALKRPYQAHLSGLVHKPTFRRPVGPAIFAKIKVVKDLGNLAVHSHKAVHPLSLQREFARRVQAVEKLKTAQRASLAELDALFATLQHRAFRGEL